VTRLLDVVISAMGAAVAFCMVFAAEWLNAFGPGLLADTWFGDALSAGLWMCAFGIAGFSLFRFPGFVGFGISFLALGGALILVQLAVTAWAFDERGRTTTCTVLRVDERVQTSTDSQGVTNQTYYYDHRLRCTAVEVDTLTTTGSAAARAGDRLDALYDPTRRLPARLADDRPADRDLLLLLATLAMVVAAVARAVSELRPARERGFFGVETNGLARILLGTTACGLVLISLVPLYAAFHFPRRAIGHVLTRIGIDRAGLLHDWQRWLIDLPVLVVSTAVAGLTLTLLLKLWSRVLSALPFLDPTGIVRAFVGGADTEYRYTVGGLEITTGGGLLGVIKRLVPGWLRRTRPVSRHRRGADRRP
jgi:hypothetical protein